MGEVNDIMKNIICFITQYITDLILEEFFIRSLAFVVNLGPTVLVVDFFK